MKKEEKTELTREKILAAAMQEFGVQGYDRASVNHICDTGISKGLIYHNFKNKDELYLICVDRCFSDVTAYLSAQNINGDLKRYIKLRYSYFKERKTAARIFFEAVLYPPAELSAMIREKKQVFDMFNRRVYRDALSKLKLQPGVSEEEALNYFDCMQEMFNGYFGSPAFAEWEFSQVVEAHEEKLAKLLTYFLYGIAVKKEESE